MTNDAQQRDSAHAADIIDAARTNMIARDLQRDGWTAGQIAREIYGPRHTHRWRYPARVTRLVADRMRLLAHTPPPDQPPYIRAAPVGDRPWLGAAACRGLDPNIFFPESGEAVTEPLAICARCTVMTECRTWAVAHVTSHHGGIWGGLTGRQLDHARRARR